MTATRGSCRTPDCDELVAEAFVCSTCAHRLRITLTDVPGLLAELALTVARQDRRGPLGASRRGGERPLPYRVDAAITRDALASTLTTWALTLAGDLLAAPPARTPAGLARWLADRVEQIRHHPHGGQLVDEITAAAGAARDEVHGRDDGERILAGHCPGCGTPAYARRGAAVTRCRTDGCGEEIDVAAGRAARLDALDALELTAADAARVLTALGEPLTRNRIAQWHRRGTLSPVRWERARSTSAGDGEERAGRPLFRVADVRARLRSAPDSPHGAPAA